MEESVLFCLRKGGEPSSGPIGKKCPGVAIVASIMLELALRDRLLQTGEDLFKLQGDQLTGDDIIDDTINIMKTAGAASVDEWLKSLIGTLVTRKGIPDLENRVYRRLVAKKVLQEEKTMLGGAKFPFYDNPEIDRLTQKLRNILSTTPIHIDELSTRDFCIVGLFNALDKPFVHRPGNALDINRIYPDKDERKKMRENVEALLQESNKDGNAGEALGVGESVQRSLARRIMRVTFLGAFNILLNL